MWETIAAEASAESSLWRGCLLPRDERKLVPVFSPFGPEELALGLETIYEGYLVHYGRSRLFSPGDEDTALLLGDYLYAHGLVRVAESGNVAAVSDLADLISLCAQGRAERRADERADWRDGDAAAWAATAARLGEGGLEDARDELRVRGRHALLEGTARESAGDEAFERARAAHARLVG